MTTLQHQAVINTDMQDLVKQNCEWWIKQLPMSSTEDLQNVSINDKKNLLWLRTLCNGVQIKLKRGLQSINLGLKKSLQFSWAYPLQIH